MSDTIDKNRLQFVVPDDQIAELNAAGFYPYAIAKLVITYDVLVGYLNGYDITFDYSAKQEMSQSKDFVNFNLSSTPDDVEQLRQSNWPGNKDGYVGIHLLVQLTPDNDLEPHWRIGGRGTEHFKSFPSQTASAA